MVTKRLLPQLEQCQVAKTAYPLSRLSAMECSRRQVESQGRKPIAGLCSDAVGVEGTLQYAKQMFEQRMCVSVLFCASASIITLNLCERINNMIQYYRIPHTK